MPALNHIRLFRPLRGGIAIHNPNSSPNGGPYGTLGFVATSDGSDRWLVSCYHVLCRLQGAMPPGNVEQVYQPFFPMTPTPVGIVTPDRADEALDCAAALIPGGQAVGEILGIGRLGPPADPVAGMRVIKSGAETGVTEAVVLSVAGNEVEIVQPDFPIDYDLSSGGDSGALWVDAATMSPVAMHYRGNEQGTRERAFARPIKAVLDALKLKML